MNPRRTSQRGIAASLVALTITLAPLSAFAGEGETGTEGERLFRDGRALMLQGSFGEACPMLEQSQKLEPHVGTLLNLAACHERQGKTGSAWVEYQKALTAARAEGQADRAQLAEQRIKVLEPRVPWLRVSSALDDATITLDGGEIAHAAWDQDMPVDPGDHVIVGERQGTKVFEARVTLRESDRRTVRVVAERLADPPVDTGKEPQRIVVEPSASEPTKSRVKGRWVIEAGAFVGYLTGTSASPTAGSFDAARVELVSTTAGQASATCASSSRCEVGPVSSTSANVGISIFGGYAVSEHVDVGVRILGAPSVGDGGVWGFGPALAFHPTDSVSLGVWALFGDAKFKGNADVTAAGYNVSQNRVRAEGVLGGGVGAGVELSVRLFELGRGTVVAQTTPFFLSGNGSAFCVPLGVAYRFQ